MPVCVCVCVGGGGGGGVNGNQQRLQITIATLCWDDDLMVTVWPLRA